MTIIMNTGRVPLQVGVVNTSTGAKSTIRVMGRGRGTPSTGWTVDTNWMAIYGKNIKLVDTSTVVTTPKPVHGKTNSSRVKERTAESATAAQVSADTIAKSPPVVPVTAPAATPVVSSTKVTPTVAPTVAPATTAPTVSTKGATT